MPKSQRRTAVALFVFVMLVVLGTGLAAAQSPEPAPVTPAQPTVEELNPLPLWLSYNCDVCYDGVGGNGCQPEAPGPCCWHNGAYWHCTTATSAIQCRSKCATACGGPCFWI